MSITFKCTQCGRRFYGGDGYDKHKIVTDAVVGSRKMKTFQCMTNAQIESSGLRADSSGYWYIAPPSASKKLHDAYISLLTETDIATGFSRSISKLRHRFQRQTDDMK